MRFLVDSPVGPLGVHVEGDTVVGVRFGATAGWVGAATAGGAVPGGPVPDGPVSVGPVSAGAGRPAGSHPAVEELTAYFAGSLTSFAVAVRMPGGSDFERAVWAEIARIPYGEMLTYGAIATALGDPGAARAVGTACNHNPVPVIVPCHRVVGAGAKMVGFGGGLDRKRKLLELEARVRLTRLWGPDR